MISPQHGLAEPRSPSSPDAVRGSGEKAKRSPAYGSIAPAKIIVEESYSVPSSPEIAGDRSDPLVGTVISDRYEILARLGQGGMGAVYRGRHLLLDAPVAVKILLEQRDKVAQARFLQEAKLASKVHHPNTVYISDFGVLDDGRLYLVMELLSGPTLSSEISRGRVDPLRACRIALQIASGLQAIHDAGIIHRDLKPDNIFLVNTSPQAGPVSQPGQIRMSGVSGQQGLVKIVDFGIALTAGAPLPKPTPGAVAPPAPPPITPSPVGHTDGRLTIAGVVMGTPLYMSPEQVEGRDLDTRSDQYALGCILYEMLVGTVPFDGTLPHVVMLKHLHEAAQRPEQRCPEAKISPALSALVMRTLEKDRAQRFDSITSLIKDLQREITRLLVSRGDNVLVTKSSADMFGRARKFLTYFGLPTLLLLGGGGYLGLRHLSSRSALEQSASPLKPGELLAARREALTLMQEALSDSSTEARLSALMALGQTRDPSLRTRIEPLLDDPLSEVAGQAAAALALLGDRGSLPALRALLDKSSPDAKDGSLRVAVAAALDQLGDSDGTRALRQAMESGNAEARLKAALLLCDRGEPRARAMLSTATKNPKLPDEAAITLLGRLLQSGDTEARTQLARIMNTHGLREVQLLAATKLAQSGDAEGRNYLRTLITQHGQEQLPAARFLASPDESAGLDLLRRVVGDAQASQSERLLAIAGLGQAGRMQDIRLLKPLLEIDPSLESRVRRGAAAAVLQLSSGEPGTLSEQSLRWARLAVSDGDLAVREAAALVLGDAPSAQAGVLLAALAQDRESGVRRAAVRALGRRNDLAALDVLRSRIKDSDASVRIEALRALSMLAQTLVKKGASELVNEVISLVKATLDHGAPQEQLLGRIVLLRLGDTGQRQALSGWLSSGDVELRRLLIESVGNDVNILRGALADESPELRLLAARQLAVLHDSRAIPILREALTKGGVGGQQAYAALQQLGEVAQPPTDLSGKETSVEQRIALVQSMADLPASEAIIDLRRAAHDSDSTVRMQVAEVAAGLPMLPAGQGPGGAAVLRLLLEDLDMGVRARAAALLGRLLTPPTPTPNPSEVPSATADKSAAKTPEKNTDKPEPVAAAGTTIDAPVQPATTPPIEAAPPIEPAPVGDVRPEESALKQLTQNAVRSLGNKDFGKAQQLLEKAQRLCAKERGSAAACAEVSFDVSYHLGRAHEEQRHLAQAMIEYEKAIKLAAQGRGKQPLLGEAQEAVMRLVPRLGVVVVPKIAKDHCREVSIWMEPGLQEIQVNGQVQTVEVRAHVTKKVGACP